MSRLLALHTAVTNLPVHARRDRSDNEAGMTTAEYSMGTVAACGFGGILYKILTSEEVLKMIKDVIKRAFSVF